MISHSESYIQHVSAHIVGNNANGEKLKLSSEPLDVEEDEIQKLLLRYFLSSFQSPEYFRFESADYNSLTNPIFTFVSDIFLDTESLHENSINIATHLYQITQHPNIKAGDLYVAYISDLRMEGKIFDAIGIFKSENKDSYLKLQTASKVFALKSELGINIEKLDKGCIILNTETENGYKILAVDNVNKNDAQFWINDFLKISPNIDGFHHTKNFMNMTRQYIDDQLDEEFAVSKADKIEFLNRSKHFFTSKEEFNKHEFEAEVFADPSVIESFRKYEQSRQADSDDGIVDNFEISAHAVKKQMRVFKSVLKLDKNFHIYIHGGRELIEKGFDEDMNKHYYKIYFDSES
jgi:hypothetical protein